MQENGTNLVEILSCIGVKAMPYFNGHAKKEGVYGVMKIADGNHWCSRDYGSGAANPNSYHYSNSDGSYYYSNPNGSTYHNNGNGGSTHTPPSASGGKK
ncbi:hypothetical protein BO94DRAFT_619831 [Aspergillus sclerotioniger CBS 115572]|uniref:Uncharacterized protein n=1 Tax=Aspergillus sclerotioniger CBS 115572 TaxID=1450535 RepID=A0A317XDX8_9EURO|nr:hypothetical protein BO94DRAFT_619831 [Aspergillus sclerotioniger CBS 115572]PWY96754.1 hypothetical protein BO94DRAFT_619831 [Aspergillus sclerotioniger CBS 115572]